VAAGTNAFNQLRERDVDARMRRTERRPLPSGRLTPRAAGLFAGVISVAGVLYLALAVNLLTAGLAALTLASYVAALHPTQAKTTLNTLIGAVPGALPIVGGWTAAGGRRLRPAVAALFWILFLWQLPHFLALAWIYRRITGAAASRCCRSRTPTVGTPAARMVLRCTPWPLLPVSPVCRPLHCGRDGRTVFLRGAGPRRRVYGRVRRDDQRRHRTARAWRVFLVSIVYLPALLTLMVVDKVV